MDLHHVYQIKEGARKVLTWSPVKKKKEKDPKISRKWK